MQSVWTRGVMLVALLATVVAPLPAQAVLGIGEDAAGVPRGQARLTIGISWSRYDELFDADGDTRALGRPFTQDSLGATVLEPLRALEASLRSLSGLADVRVTLGTSATTTAVLVSTVPLAGEIGITDRLTMGVVVPIVETRATPQLSVNPSAAGGNIAPNPAAPGSAEQAVNVLFFQQLAAAQTQLAALITACQAGSSDPRCPAVLAQGPALQAQAVPFGAQLQSVFNGRFVPLVGTPADVALRLRLSGFTTAYNTLLGSSVISAQQPLGATLAFSTDDLQDLLRDPIFGVDPLLQVKRTRLGDMEVRGQLRMIGAMRTEDAAASGFRLAVGGLVRLGTGSPADATNLVVVGTGDGQTDIEARAVADVAFGSRFWLSVAGRYGWQLADELPRRIAARDDPFPPAYTTQRVERDLGDYFELEATPRFTISRYFLVGAQYLVRGKAEDRYSGTFNVQNLDGEPVTLDASLLGIGTEQREHRVTAGVVFSSVSAFGERQARLPIEISYRWMRTIAGSGFVPKASVQAIQARLYLRLFGPDARRPAAAAR